MCINAILEIKMSQIPEPLIILEMANNHMGSVEHGTRIIKQYANFIKEFPRFHFAFKLQYRDLETFIRQDFKNRTDVKLINRFEETKLTREGQKSLVLAMKNFGFIAMCTPFDERSVDSIVEDEFDILKIASCSFGDWPLLETAVSAGLPIVASTAGASIEQIDNVISFFEHRSVDFSLQHCVGEYPTPLENMNLNQIDHLRERHPDVRFGFSTHESPDNTDLVRMAIAKGAVSLEKHIGIPTQKSPLNDYSSNYEQTRAWIVAAEQAKKACGMSHSRYKPSELEVNSLKSLQRGVFAKTKIKIGEKLTMRNTYLAFPPSRGQLTAANFSKYNQIVAVSDIEPDGEVQLNAVKISNNKRKLLTYAEEVISLLKESGAVVPRKFDLEISHHFGLENFKKYGLSMITTINRGYCKKILICLPGQLHPEQYHLKKEETFNVLYGTLKLTLDSQELNLNVGDVITIKSNQKHQFVSDCGAVLEEISTTHFANDSFYTDTRINTNKDRKSFVKWIM